jgi:hypothetical protein
MHWRTGHNLDKLLYSNADLKKCFIHRILLNWHLFPNLKKKHLRGQRFSTDDELKSATEQWLRGQSETFYLAGIEKLRDRYKLCIDKGGDYVEK